VHVDNIHPICFWLGFVLCPDTKSGQHAEHSCAEEIGLNLGFERLQKQKPMALLDTLHVLSFTILTPPSGCTLAPLSADSLLPALHITDPSHHSALSSLGFTHHCHWKSHGEASLLHHDHSNLVCSPQTITTAIVCVCMHTHFIFYLPQVEFRLQDTRMILSITGYQCLPYVSNCINICQMIEWTSEP
jgi:hypothetical protein